MTFEEYLNGKKIDSKIFQEKEPVLWNAWREEFDQIHPKSFTAQKLYLINPVRRKYPLKEELKPASAEKKETVVLSDTPKTTAKPKPVFKPKPKIN